VALAPLRVAPRRDVPSDHITIPSHTRIDRQIHVEAGAAVKNLHAHAAPHRITVDSPFDFSAPRLALKDWGDQAFLRSNWTLTHLIEAVAHSDGGAHIKMDERIESLQRWGHLHWHLVARIGYDVFQQGVESLCET
jgi:hypothetical protein